MSQVHKEFIGVCNMTSIVWRVIDFPLFSKVTSCDVTLFLLPPPPPTLSKPSLSLSLLLDITEGYV